ncbi:MULTISPECIES: hypothetical protein [unclassified Virgibacillus]|uniref:hypothetical protein n=1 Tax=unclassified Virgibacillus TaxID=2620237 RepID=UPI0024DE3F68|nr:hypothetical protein [Virgibacillus sp. LDC-1]
MVESVVIIGAVMTLVLLVIGFALAKAASKATYLPYYPALVIFGSGLVMVVSATMVGKIEMMGAPLGGWGIAFMFSAAIGTIITSIVHVNVKAS